MFGMNVVALTGNVGTVGFAKTTKKAEDVCTFTLAIQKDKFSVTWVRVNVYGTLVEICRGRLGKGDMIGVEGELMNRRVSDSGESFMTEIRCKSLKFS